MGKMIDEIFDRDYQQARKELNAARQTLPNNPQVFEYNGYIERRQGDWASATRDFEQSIELDPRNFQTIQQLAEPTKLTENVYQAAFRALLLPYDDPGHACHMECPCHTTQ